jgi:serine/threonine protein kinase
MLGPAETESAAPGVFVLDFGIGTLLAESAGESFVDTMSTANAVSSSLDCASPESIVNPKCLSAIGDQYSLGCVLYYCLAGRYPFTEDTTAGKIMAVQLKRPTPLRELVADIPETVVTVVERLMQKAPADRYANTTEVVAALRSLADTLPPTPNVTRRPARRIGTAQSASLKDHAETSRGRGSPFHSDARNPSHERGGPDGHDMARAAPPSRLKGLPVRTPTAQIADQPDRVEEHDQENESLSVAGLVLVAAVVCILGWLLTW